MKGWITLHRKIEENELWLAEPFTKGQAWVDLLLLANHRQQTIWKRGIKVVINRGEVGWSEVALAKRWKWSRDKVRNFLKYLKTIQQIERQSNHTLSRIIIINYNKYQRNQTTDQTTDQTVNNNDNNDNNITAQGAVEELKANQETMGWKEQRYADDYIEEIQVDPDHKKPVKKKVSNELQEVFTLFAKNPAHKAWHLWPKERESAKILLEAYGIDTLKKRVTRIQLEAEKNDPLFPLITSPSQLLEKMPNVERYLKL